MIRPAEDNGEKDEASIMSEKEDDVELEDHAVAPGNKRRVFSIPKPPVLRRSPIGSRSSSRRFAS